MWQKKPEHASASAILRHADLKKAPVNRKLIVWVFLGTGLLSALAMWVGGKNGEARPEGESQGWWGPSILSFDVRKKEDARHQDDTEMVSRLKERAALDQGTYGVYVYRLEDNTGYGFGEDEVMPAVSIMKVPIMAAVEKQIHQGKVRDEDTYVLANGDKREGSGPIGYFDAGTELTVRKLMEEMGKKSDNTAPVVLTRMIGKETVMAVMQELDMHASDFGENTTTARDVANMWVKLYRREVVQEEGIAAMWEYLQDSIYEDRIPVGVPEEVEVIHKVGTDINVWADAGIVIDPSGNVPPFVMVIMNKDVHQDEAKITVPELVKMVWEYESTRKKS